jgi:predicted amidophosphoribosyltransferase
MELYKIENLIINEKITNNLNKIKNKNFCISCNKVISRNKSYCIECRGKLIKKKYLDKK